MHSSLFLFITLFCSAALHAQRDCRTHKDTNGVRTTCRHSDGSISTIEFWDAATREGHVTGFSSKGVELFHYAMRRYAGHASVRVDYFDNGQVRRVHYSEAPDGGIQFHKIDCSYSATGELEKCFEDSYPDRSPIRPFINSPSGKETVESEMEAIVMCASPCMSVFKLVNQTRRTVRVKLHPVPNQWRNFPEREVCLKRGETMPVDSLLMADLFFSPASFYSITARNHGLWKTSVSSIIVQHPDVGTHRIYEIRIQ